jgi:hypothetical protein
MYRNSLFEGLLIMNSYLHLMFKNVWNVQWPLRSYVGYDDEVFVTAASLCFYCPGCCGWHTAPCISLKLCDDSTGAHKREKVLLILIALLIQIRDLMNNANELAAQYLSIVCDHCCWLDLVASQFVHWRCISSILAKSLKQFANRQAKN